MVEKQYIAFLESSPVDRIRCAFETKNGKVTRLKVVQYETYRHGEWTPVVRYDTAHGFFHRDVYVFGGKKHFKENISSPSLEAALNFAIDDIHLNWRKHKSTFLEQDNGKDNL